MKNCSFLTSKNKGLIPFRMIEKYKYIFFVTVSVVGGRFVVVFTKVG